MLNNNLLKLSVGSGKMEKISSLNTDTTINEFCIKMNNSEKENIICSDCYSMKMLKTYRKNCIPNFRNNSKLLSESLIHWDLLPIVLNSHFRFNSHGLLSESLIHWDLLPIVLNSHFRFNSHGELINKIHFKNLIRICLKNPYCHFTLWTKRANIINSCFKEINKPKNLNLIFSNSIIDKPLKKIPKYFDKTFNNVSKDYKQKSEINCNSKCVECMVCYLKKDKKNNIRHIIELEK